MNPILAAAVFTLAASVAPATTITVGARQNDAFGQLQSGSLSLAEGFRLSAGQSARITATIFLGGRASQHLSTRPDGQTLYCLAAPVGRGDYSRLEEEPLMQIRSAPWTRT